MKKPKTTARLTGTRIRERRLAQGRRQADLARQVGISPTYLNLIEHNKRPIAGKLLIDLARALGVDAGELSGGAEVALLGLLSAAGTRLPEAKAELDQVGELAGRFPGWAAVIAAQHQRIRALERLTAALSDRLSHDPQLAASLHEVLSTVTAIRSAVSILSEGGALDPEWQARFLRNVAEDSARLSEAAQGLAGYLEAGADEQAGHLSPQEELGAFLEARNYFFAPLEPGGWAGVEALIEGAGQELSTQAARGLARDWLRRYQRDAAALPLAHFAGLWADAGGDALKLATRAGVDLAQVLRRAACCGDRSAPGLVICDGTGTLTTRREMAGFSVPRFGAACPRWPLFQALAQPGRPIRARLEMPGEPRQLFDCIAIAQAQWPEGLDGLPVYEATMLIRADQRGEAGAPADTALKVGPGCRICPRPACPARREASLLAEEPA